ncbi:hypothetical protein HD554DRAFT_1193734 [Boletus coccyginus]|nr:hypothetical protein HD554DRAFT_1193734 [Boletus coccyginus]
MNTANPAQSVTAKTIAIKDIQLQNQAQRKLPVARRYHVQFTVGDTSRSTNNAKEARKRTSWDENFYFDGDDGSVLLVNVYQKFRIGEDKLIGSLTDTVAGLLRKLKDGVFEDALRKDTSDGSDLSEITIKFALAAEPRVDIDTDERQASDAVAVAIAAVNQLGSTPAAVGLLGSPVDIGTKISATSETTWDTLLKRIMLFNDITTRIAEIHPPEKS